MGRVAVNPRGARLPVVDVRPAVRAAWLVVAVLALLGAVVGGGLLVRDRAAERLTGPVTVDGLTARLHDAGWVSMDGHRTDNQGGYQMPAQMMPGAPSGDEMRLGVPLTLVNAGRQARGFSLVDEFFLGGGRNPAPRELHSDTFGQLPRLGPGSAVDGVIYFDTTVPNESDPPLYLLWKRGGASVQLAIPRISETTDHEHNG